MRRYVAGGESVWGAGASVTISQETLGDTAADTASATTMDATATTASFVEVRI
jgi:hypothetical protein